MNKLDFLKSRRFWGLVIIAVAGVLRAEGILPDEIVNGIIIIVSGFIGIRTLDKVTANIK